MKRLNPNVTNTLLFIPHVNAMPTPHAPPRGVPIALEAGVNRSATKWQD